MGYRSEVVAQARARELRAQAWTLQQIADEPGVAKSSVSLWVRDVSFTPRPSDPSASRRRGPNTLQRRKQAEIDELLAAGRQRIGQLSEREFLVAALLLYAGEGAKTDGAVKLANSDAALVALFCAWLRHFFDIDEARLRVHLYLPQGLDLDAAITFWSQVTNVPRGQFGRPYRAVADPSLRRTKHVHGCATIGYCCSRTHRGIIGLMGAAVASRAWSHHVTPTDKVDVCVDPG